MPSLTIAVPTAIGHLGLGGAAQKVLLCLHAEGWKVRGIDVKGPAAVAAGFEVSSIDLLPFMWVATRSPLRYRQDWLLNLGNFSFDLLASARLGCTDVFYGFSMASIRTIRKAKKAGALTVLLAAPSYLPSARKTLESEYARLGAGRQPFNDAAVVRATSEYREADLIRVESQLARQSLLDGGVTDDKIFVLPPSVDVKSFRPAGQRSDRFTVVFVGSFNVRKGIHHLLAAWDLIGRDDDLLILHGGGDGWADRLIARYTSRANVVLSQGAPHETFRAASVCVCPSIEDAFCNVALEAMASGVPVIVSDSIGAKDLIQDGQEGFVVTTGDVVAFAERIRYLRDHPVEWSRMAAAARRRAELCTLENEGSELDRILQAALAGRRPPCNG